MFKIAFKVAKENKARFIFTILGYTAASFLMAMGLYYTHVTESVVEDNFNQDLSENRVILNQVTVPCVTYYDTGEDMIPEAVPINNSAIASLLSTEGVKSIKVEYELFQPLEIIIDGKRLGMDVPYAVDAKYESISQAMVDGIKKEDTSFKDIISGKKLESDEPMTALIGEACVAYLGYTNEEVIGKEITVIDSNKTPHSVTIVGVYDNRLSSYYQLVPNELKGTYYETDELDYFVTDFIFNYKLFEKIKEDISPSSIYLSMSDTKYIDDVVDIIENQYDMTYLSDYKAYYEQISQQEKMAKVFGIVGMMILILVLLMIFNTLLINITQQKRLTALLRLLGYSKKKVRLFFVYQAIVFSGIGILLGTLLGILLSTYQGLSIVNGMKEFNVSSSDFLMPFDKTIVLTISILFISIVGSYIVVLLKTRERNKYE